MGTASQISELERFISGPLASFLTKSSAEMWPAVAGRCKDHVSSGSLLPSDVDYSLAKIRKNQAEDDQLAALTTSHDSVPELKKRGTRLGSSNPYLGNLFYGGVARLIFLRLSGGSEEKALIEVLHGYRRLMIQREQECMVGAAFNLNGVPAQGVNLGRDTTLRCLSGEEYGHVGWHTPFFSQPRPGTDGWSKLHWPSIITDHRTRTIDSYVDCIPMLTSHLRQEVHACMAFLQLEIDGRIRPTRVFLLDSHWLPNIFGDARRLSVCIESMPDRRFGARDEVLALNPDNVVILKERWAEYQEALKESRFRLACSRYSISLERETEEDRIIDHWIALESLFTKQNEEIGSLAAAKIAILLGGDLRDRKKRRKAIKRHYAVRSGLVHGGKDLDKLFGRFCYLWKEDAPLQEFNRYFTALQSQRWLEYLLKLLVSEPQALDELDDVLVSGDPKFRMRKPGYWAVKIKEAKQNDIAEATEQ